MNNNELTIDESQHTITRMLPHNTLAEQVLLGAVITNNESISRLNDFLLADHFFEPVHRRIYESINILFERGVVASPITLKNHFDKDNALQDIGGANYLVKLASLATTIINVVDYGKIIYDLAVRA